MQAEQPEFTRRPLRAPRLKLVLYDTVLGPPAQDNRWGGRVGAQELLQRRNPGPGSLLPPARPP